MVIPCDRPWALSHLGPIRQIAFAPFDLETALDFRTRTMRAAPFFMHEDAAFAVMEQWPAEKMAEPRGFRIEAGNSRESNKLSPLVRGDG